VVAAAAQYRPGEWLRDMGVLVFSGILTDYRIRLSDFSFEPITIGSTRVQTLLFRGTAMEEISRMPQILRAERMHGTPASSVKTAGLRPSLCTETERSHSTLAQWKTRILKLPRGQSASSNSHRPSADTVMARRTQVHAFQGLSLPISLMPL
jgi:hypothetical protein